MKIKDKLCSVGNDSRRPEPVEPTSKRLRKAMELRQLKQKDLVDKTGIDKGSISHYLSGRYEPKKEAMNNLADALDVSEMWLWGYDVPMEKSTRLFGEEENPYALEVSDTLDTLEVDNQIYVRDWVNNFAKNPEEMKSSPDQLVLTEGEKALIKLLRRVPAAEQPIVIEKILSALDDQE